PFRSLWFSLSHHAMATISICSFARFAVLTLAILCLGCQKESESIVSIALHPKNANILYVATNDAVYKSRDGGETWEKFPSFSARRVTTLAIDPLLPATVYAGTMGDAVYKSPDGGQRWLPHNVGLKDHVSFVNQFVFHPATTENIYAATTVGVFYTKDAGREWEERMNGMKEVHIVTSLAINPQEPAVLYAGTTGGIYRSDDGGMNWRKINTGLIPETELMGAMALGVNAIEIDRTNPAVVYAGTTKGLFRTTNRGEQWERIGQRLPDPFVCCLVLHPTDPTVLYLGGPAGVWKSSDGGGTWQAMNRGLATLNIRALVLAPTNSRTLYAGTNGSGLYRSTDAGESWVPVPLKAAAKQG
ncbi:MAG: YCF48-related protein, partial [Nitrospira sp.]|nr:YCF48-related protein [Nitrospira sp.]